MYFSLHATSWSRTTLIWRHSINSTSTSAKSFKKYAMIFDKRRVNQLNVSPANGRSYLKYVTPQNRSPINGTRSTGSKTMPQSHLGDELSCFSLPPLVPVSVQQGNYHYVGWYYQTDAKQGVRMQDTMNTILIKEEPATNNISRTMCHSINLQFCWNLYQTETFAKRHFSLFWYSVLDSLRSTARHSRHMPQDSTSSELVTNVL